jgi:sec-independent protein translocase protein TatA
VPISAEWIVVIAVVVLLFGASQLPKLARSLGEAKNEFEKAQKTDETSTASKDDNKA